MRSTLTIIVSSAFFVAAVFGVLFLPWGLVWLVEYSLDQSGIASIGCTAPFTREQFEEFVLTDQLRQVFAAQPLPLHFLGALFWLIAALAVWSFGMNERRST